MQNAEALQLEHTIKNRTNTPTSCISWKAILGGVFITLFISALFNLLGLGLELTATNINSVMIGNVGIGSITWLILSTVISTLAGGWVAGRFSGINFAVEGIIHGLITCAVVTMLPFLLIVTSVYSFLNSSPNIIVIAEKSNDSLGKIAIITFFVLIMSATAGAFGGMLGAVRSRKWLLKSR